MRICIATGIFPPDKGGPAQFSSAYAKWLTENNNEVVVLSLTDLSSEITTKGSLKIILHSRKASLITRFIKTANSIRKISKDHVILANGLFLEIFFASLFARISYIAKVPGDIVWERARNRNETKLNIDQYQGQEQISKKLMRWCFTQSLKRSRYVIAPSAHMKNLITAWGIKPEKIVVIPNSVDIDLFAPNLSANKSFDLITICRLTPWKGVSELIEESAKKDLSIAIVGSGSEEQSLRVLADKLKAKATFLGEQIQSELPSLINKSKVFVLNSNYEGSPHALLEAMACGAISVARGTTGTNEVIKDGINGFLFGSSRTLGAALDLALNEVGRKSDISTRARALVVDNNDRDQHFIKITNLLREVS